MQRTAITSRFPAARVRRAVVVLVLLLVAAAATANSTRRPKFDTWLNGAEGMFEAMRQYDEQERPILVYFYTDWCGYCRQFETVLLSEDYVEDYLERLIKVRINPERGPLEAQISKQYGVRGYPAIFMHSGSSKSLSSINRLAVENGQPRLLSAEEFVDVLRGAATR